MIALQRHRRIVEYVVDRGVGRVAELARAFGVTEETIRRDLRALAERGKLARTYGGAVPVERDDARTELPYLRRDSTNVEAKAAIAVAALEHIKPGQVIALDASSTACHLAGLIPDLPLTVVTNSLVVCSQLAGKRRVRVICTGGELDSEALDFTGMHARRALSSFNIETLLFSCRGIDLDRGISEANDQQAAVKLEMIEASKRCILLADTSKLGVSSTVFVCPIGLADHVIVERSSDPETRSRVRQLRDVVREVTEA